MVHFAITSSTEFISELIRFAKWSIKIPASGPIRIASYENRRLTSNFYDPKISELSKAFTV